MFLDDEIIDMIVSNTNIYAQQKNITFVATPQQIYRFIGILFLSGYHSLPQIEHYWSVQPDLGLLIVRQSMTRHTFRTLKSILHLMDNNSIDKSDRFAKVRPLMDLLNKKYKQVGIFTTHLSIDEQMIPYFGRHNCKMFIRGKPIRFGFKLWCLCSDSGFLFHAIPYAGKGSSYDKNVGLGASAILSMIESIEDPEVHAFYFDNFFTSYYLLGLLNERKIRAIGTVRSNRLRGANSVIATGKSLKKHSYDTCFENTNKISVCRWQDNSEVTVASNFIGAEPTHKASRYSREEKKIINIPQPRMICEYNKHMGGVDLHDNAVSNYRIAIRGKKWWWPLFTNCLNTASVNAWKIHCLIAKKSKSKSLSQIEFKSEVTRALLTFDERLEEAEDEESDSDAEEEERPRKLPRLNIQEHVICENPQKRRLRCAQCHSQTIYQCKKCNAALHVKCFDVYHDLKS